MSRFTYLLTAAARSTSHINALVCISRNNELFDEIARVGDSIVPIDTFSTHLGSIGRLYRIIALRRFIRQFLVKQRVEAVVSLMSHAWSPLVADIPVRLKIPYCVIVHDVERRPGELRGLIYPWLLYDARRADRVITLSQSVTNSLIRNGSIPSERIATLFHPNLNERPVARPRHRDVISPLRVLFFGQIFAYKGLEMLVSTIEQLRGEGIAIELGVYGEGLIGQETSSRLAAMGATVVNRWVDECEIDDIFSHYEVMVLPYVQASQSAAAALALGFGLPVVVTPVGGLVEQVSHDVNGLVAESVSAKGLAVQIRRLAMEPGLYDRLSQRLLHHEDRSMEQFLNQLTSVIPFKG